MENINFYKWITCVLIMGTDKYYLIRTCEPNLSDRTGFLIGVDGDDVRVFGNNLGRRVCVEKIDPTNLDEVMEKYHSKQSE